MNRKVRDTALGAWLQAKAPKALDIVGDLLPDRGVLGIVKNLVETGDEVSPEERAEFLRVLENEKSFSEQVTRRWEADSKSDAPLAKIIRPVALIFSLVGFFVIMVLDSCEGIGFHVSEAFAGLLETLTLTISGAYFAGRTLEKTFKR